MRFVLQCYAANVSTQRRAQVPRIAAIEVVDRHHGFPSRQGVHDLAGQGKIDVKFVYVN